MAPVFTGNWFGFGRNPASEPSGPADTSFASGGIISDVEISGTLYRAHIFTSSGSLVVNGPGSKNMTYLVVGGGGGGSASNGIAGAAGAGGLRTNLPGVVDADSNPLTISTAFPLSAGTYPVTVGAGGGSGVNPASGTGHYGKQGGDSQFGPPTATAVSGKIVASGGGRGRTNEGGYPTAPLDQGWPGGCGGGGAGNSPTALGESPGGEGNKGGNYDSKPEGKDGGTGGPTGNYGSGGGGGVGQAGQAYQPGGPTGVGGKGGDGVQCLILGPATQTTFGLGAPGNSSQTGWFGGGGGSSGYAGHGVGGVGGGGGSALSPQGVPQNGGGQPGAYGTGGGGGSAAATGPAENGGQGGPGIVVVRYEVSSPDGDAKASGGNINFYNGKTIHTFLTPGNFVTDGDMGSQTAEYVILAGGGGGGSTNGYGGGGGGAGGYLTGTTPIGNSQTISVSVGEGGNTPKLTAMGDQGGNSAVGFPAGTITATGGGGGGYDSGPNSKKGDPGGSGGGNGGGPQTQGGPEEGTSGQGNDGGEGSPSANPGGAGGGGGGAGGAGGNAPTNHTPAGAGGVGVQLPATFQDPHMATALGYPGPGGTSYWVAGGGGGGGAYNGTNPGGGGGGHPTPNESYAGAGYGSRRGSYPSTRAGMNSGSGGGGGAGPTDTGTGTYSKKNKGGGTGGPGIVLIAYPT